MIGRIGIVHEKDDQSEADGGRSLSILKLCKEVVPRTVYF